MLLEAPLYVGYADDVPLLALSPSALHYMLRICSEFAEFHGLSFNAAKTQLIKFLGALLPH